MTKTLWQMCSNKLNALGTLGGEFLRKMVFVLDLPAYE